MVTLNLITLLEISMSVLGSIIKTGIIINDQNENNIFLSLKHWSFSNVFNKFFKMLLLKYVHDTGFAKYTLTSKYTYALRRVLYAKKEPQELRS